MELWVAQYEQDNGIACGCSQRILGVFDSQDKADQAVLEDQEASQTTTSMYYSKRNLEDYEVFSVGLNDLWDNAVKYETTAPTFGEN